MSKDEIDALIGKILISRGIPADQHVLHLDPSYERDTHKPDTLPDIHKASLRIVKAVENNETIAVFSDYDADGIPGAVIMTDFFREIGYEHFFIYIPHRHHEGFGLNTEAVREIATRGAKLMITVDCGITDVDDVAEANALGIDVIITDHHVPGDTLPDAYAIINPKRIGSEYPNKELCGAAVAYKVYEYIVSQQLFPQVKVGRERWSLDMVGIATLSDMVPLTHENRVLAHFGLKVLRMAARHGLQKMYANLRIRPHNLTEDDITFMITPRINAASRMEDPIIAYKALALKGVEGEAHADALIKINDNRKKLVASSVKKAKALIEGMSEEQKNKPFIVVGDPDWNPGVLGLIASNIADAHDKVVFVWGRGDSDVIKGSVRGDGWHIVDIMKSAHKTADGGLFIDFGGHEASGGFSIEQSRVVDLESALESAFAGYQKNTDTDALEQPIAINVGHITIPFIRTLSMIGPFGMDNPKPLFVVEGIIETVAFFGKNKEHIRITLADGPATISCIAFFAPKEIRQIDERPLGSKVSVYGYVEVDTFTGRPSPRFRIERIEFPQ